MKRGVALFLGAFNIVRSGVTTHVRRGMLIDFGDTLSLQQAANSGFGEFDLPDDDVAVVLEGTGRGAGAEPSDSSSQK